MRCVILVAAVAIAACTPDEQASLPALPTGNYVSDGRDALCIYGQAGAQRAGFVIYGADDANCSASGRIERVGASWSLVPAGDQECKISINLGGGRLSLGPAKGACAYYCGPGATWDGKVLSPAARTQPVTDFGGRALC